MGTSQKYSLRWNDFSLNVATTFRDLHSQQVRSGDDIIWWFVSAAMMTEFFKLCAAYLCENKILLQICQYFGHFVQVSQRSECTCTILYCTAFLCFAEMIIIVSAERFTNLMICMPSPSKAGSRINLRELVAKQIRVKLCCRVKRGNISRKFLFKFSSLSRWLSLTPSVAAHCRAHLSCVRAPPRGDAWCSDTVRWLVDRHSCRAPISRHSVPVYNPTQVTTVRSLC